jgi:hypothetical protein
MSKTNPYQIGISKNSKMNSHDVHLSIGGFTEKEAKEVADYLNKWMQKNSSDKSWFSRIN